MGVGRPNVRAVAETRLVGVLTVGALLGAGCGVGAPARDPSGAEAAAAAGAASGGTSDPGGSELEGVPAPGAASGTGQPAVAEPEPVTLLAAGDIAWCGREERATGALVASLDGLVATLGDHAYETGSVAEFDRCYAPSWGAVADRTLPAVGNHDTVTRRGRPLFDFFGPTLADGLAGWQWPDGWYSYDVGTWHVVVLNSNCGPAGGCGPDSPQVTWLRDDLDRAGADNLLAYWHHPRWSSGQHGGDASVQPFWDVLGEAGVDLVLNGHEHSYERRLVPLEDGSVARQFVVGTAGAVLRGFDRPADADVEARLDDVYGILRLELGTCTYSWELLSPGADSDDGTDGTETGATETGASVHDEGSGSVCPEDEPAEVEVGPGRGQVRAS